jgi:hypothetical protein
MTSGNVLHSNSARAQDSPAHIWRKRSEERSVNCSKNRDMTCVLARLVLIQCVQTFLKDLAFSWRVTAEISEILQLDLPLRRQIEPEDPWETPH